MSCLWARLLDQKDETGLFSSATVFSFIMPCRRFPFFLDELQLVIDWIDTVSDLSVTIFVSTSALSVSFTSRYKGFLPSIGFNSGSL